MNSNNEITSSPEIEELQEEHSMNDVSFEEMVQSIQDRENTVKDKEVIIDPIPVAPIIRPVETIAVPDPNLVPISLEESASSTKAVSKADGAKAIFRQWFDVETMKPKEGGSRKHIVDAFKTKCGMGEAYASTMYQLLTKKAKEGKPI
jgi:hypothetical protein